MSEKDDTMAVSEDPEQLDIVFSEDTAKKLPDTPSGAADETSGLLPVADDIPLQVWLAALVGAAERFVWYGAANPIRMPTKSKSKKLRA